jgi:molybdopterin synthase catalytic subunit
MIEITEQSVSPEGVVNKVKGDSSGCVVSYIGLIREYSQGKQVLTVEYRDPNRNAVDTLRIIASEAMSRWQINDIAISHRVGKLRVGYINLVVAVATAHRYESFAACQYIIDQFKQRLPTHKIETYKDDTIVKK